MNHHPDITDEVRAGTINATDAAEWRWERFRESNKDAGWYPPWEKLSQQAKDKHMAQVMRDIGPRRPLMVTAPGRSGTTLLMALLATSPDVCIAEASPFEVRLISYYAPALRVLSAAPDARSTHPDNLEGDRLHIGSNPYLGGLFYDVPSLGTLNDFRRDVVTPKLTDAFRAIILEYYARLAAAQDKLATVFAEKNNNLDPEPRAFMRATFGDAKEIILVRDPRDVFCSHRRWFKSDPEKAFDDISTACSRIMDSAAAHNADTLFVRYENLVGEQRTEMDRISKFAAITFPGHGVSFNQDHATSGSVQQSIGRWRDEMSSDERDTATVRWGAFLREFGYE